MQMHVVAWRAGYDDVEVGGVIDVDMAGRWRRMWPARKTLWVYRQQGVRVIRV